MAEGLELTAEAMERKDEDLAGRALDKLREVRDHLIELARTRQAGARIVRRSVVWRSQRAPIVRESENAGHLDLLGGSCLTLARACVDFDPSGRDMLPQVRDLASALADLGEAPGDRPTRQRAADLALEVARHRTGQETKPKKAGGTVVVFVNIVAMDVMVFAGADLAQAEAVALKDTGVLGIPAPPPAPRIPFRRKRFRR